MDQRSPCGNNVGTGAFLHFALYESKDGNATTRAQVAFRVHDLAAAHQRALDAGA